MNKEIVIKNSLTADQLAKASFYIFTSGRGIYIFCFLYIIILLNQLMLMLPPIEGTTVEETAKEPFLTGLIIMTLLPFFFYFMLKKASKKTFLKKSNFFENITFTFTEEFVKQEGEDFNVVRYWKDIYKVKESKNWFLIYTNKYQALILDKSQIDPLQIDSLKDLLNSLQSKLKLALKKT